MGLGQVVGPHCSYQNLAIILQMVRSLYFISRILKKVILTVFDNILIDFLKKWIFLSSLPHHSGGQKPSVSF